MANLQFPDYQKSLCEDLKKTFLKRSTDTDSTRGAEEVVSEVSDMLSTDIAVYAEKLLKEMSGSSFEGLGEAEDGAVLTYDAEQKKWVGKVSSGYITRGEWNDFISGTDADNVINRWSEVEKFLSGMRETDNLERILRYKLDVDVFSELFTALDSSGVPVDLSDKDAISRVATIRANYGFWSVDFVSALGKSTGSDIGGGSGVEALYELVDVKPNASGDGVLGAKEGTALIYDGTHWVAGEAGFSETQLNSYLTTNGYITKKEVDALLAALKFFEKVNVGTDASPRYALHILESMGLYSDDFISALGKSTTGGTGGGGASYERLDSWEDYDESKSAWVLSAGLGYSLRTDIAALAGRSIYWSDIKDTPSTLKGYGIVDAYTKSEVDELVLFEKVNIGTEESPVWAIHAKDGMGVYSDKFISALGVSGIGDTTGLYNRLDSWSDYDETKAEWVLSAYLGYSLYTRVTALEVSKKGHTITINGSGNVVTNVSENGNTLTFTKGDLSFARIIEKPTTIAGYGITDAYTKTEVNTKLTDGSVTKIGTADVGSATKPIYLKAGVPTAVGTSLEVDITGNSATTSKLKTAVTLWGQSFDGSEAISGEITDASDITMSGALKLNGITIEKTSSGVLRIDGDLAVTGGITMYASNGVASGMIDQVLAVLDPTIFSKQGDYITITGEIGGGTVKAVKVGSTQYDPDTNGIIALPEYPTVTTLEWDNILNKPSSFIPSAHTHAISDIVNLQATLNGKAAASHTHAIADITNISSASVSYAASAGNADTLDGNHASAFATAGHTHNYLNAIRSGTSIGGESGAWSTIESNTDPLKFKVYEVYDDGGPTAYGEVLNVTGYSNHWQAQLWMGSGKGGRLYYRNKEYNDNTWGDWRTVAFTSDNVASANYASSAGNADTVDGYHASSLAKFYLSPLDSGASASSAKSWFVNTMPSGTGCIIYNVPGAEKTIIAGKSTGPHGHMLQLNYDDNYLRILRYHAGSWKTSDWEKISAGYADSAGNADTLDGYHYSSFAWASHTHSYLPLSGGTLTGSLTLSNGAAIYGAGGYIDMQYADEINRYGGNLFIQHRGGGVTGSGTGGSTTGNLILCCNGGNVGIGTASPSYKLHVSGTLGVTGTLSVEDGALIFGWQEAHIGHNGSYSDPWSGLNADFKFGGRVACTGFWANGNILAAGGITMYSDLRKKNVISDEVLSVKEIALAPLFAHTYKSDQNHYLHIGTSAQYWSAIHEGWFTRKDSEGYYQMELQNLGVAMGISLAREIVKYESKTDKKIRLMKKKINDLEARIKELEGSREERRTA